MTTKLQTIAAMRLYGGGFVSALANAWLAADPVNQARLEAAFADKFAEFRKAAEQTEATA